MPVADGYDGVARLRQQLQHQQQAYRDVKTALKNQALAIETFQSKCQTVGQEAHAFVTRNCSEAEDFVRAEMMSVQRFEDSLQRQCDG